MEPSDQDTQGRGIGRWVPVLVVPVAAWHCVLFVGLLSTSVLDYLCPEDQRTSGSCTVDWYWPALNAFIVGWTGVSAFVVVVSAAWIAPSHRIAAGIFAFLCGAAIAAGIAIHTGSHAEFAAAIVCGALALLLVARKFRAPSPGTPNAEKG